MVCRKCGQPITSKEGDYPVLGHAHQLNAQGQKIPDSEEQFGFFHAACWEQVKAALGPAPQEQASANPGP